MAPDPKLLYYVKNVLADRPPGSRMPSEDTVMEGLMRDHKEYERKPKGPLRKQVSRALAWCLEKGETGGGGGAGAKQRGRPTTAGAANGHHHSAHGTAAQQRQQGSGSGRRGGWEEDEEDEGDEGDEGEAEAGDDEEQQGNEESGSDAEFERDARERERRLAAGGGGGSGSLNLLNNSLTASYRKTACASATVSVAMEEGGAKGATAASAPSAPASSAACTKGKIPKKRKRTVSAAGGADSGGGRRRAAPTGDDDDGGGGSNATLVVVERPSARLSDLAGVEDVLQEVRELVEHPLNHPEVYRALGVEPPRGILLHGPPGCGKTLLANAIAGQLGVSFLRVSAPELVSGMSGESEQRIRELFATAIESAPALVFIDEVDAITQKRETSQRGMERRIVAQLLTCLDSLSLENTQGRPVLVIGATNRPDSLDPALRRAGRFDREIALGVPDQDARRRILEVMTAKMRLSGDLDLDLIAKKTPGYVGADLASLTKEAAVVAINRIFQTILPAALEQQQQQQQQQQQPPEAEVGPLDMAVTQGKGHSISTTAVGSAAAGGEEGEGVAMETDTAPPIPRAVDAAPAMDRPTVATATTIPAEVLASPLLSVSMADFVAAVGKVQPSSKREGFAAVPNVTWADVGALAAVREELAMSVIEPIACPERFQALGLSVPAGVLLYGPPGCGKTLLAKAIANESGANFISVKGPELLDKYVGESERAVRQVFTRARASAPCVIFFDELDALCPRRGMGGDGGSGVSERVVNQLLTEMDGLEGRRSVFVIAATNRPELIDAAMLRPGRLDKLLYVPLPAPEDRASILQAVCRNVAIDRNSVDIEALGRDPRAEGYSGADLAALVREAGVCVLRELRRAGGGTFGPGPVHAEGTNLAIGRRHFEEAFSRVPPSVSPADQRRYLKMRSSLCRARSSVAGGMGGGVGSGSGEAGGSGEGKEA